MHADGHDRVHHLDLEGVDPRSAQVFGSFMRAMRLHRHLMFRVLAEQGTTPGQALCLRIVAAHAGATQREIGELLYLAPPTVTSMLKRMEQSGTVSREADPDDQRVTRVRLTSRGRAMDDELRGILAARIGRLLEAMPEDDRRDLARLLDDLAGRMADALAEDAARSAPAAPTPSPAAPPATGGSAA